MLVNANSLHMYLHRLQGGRVDGNKKGERSKQEGKINSIHFTKVVNYYINNSSSIHNVELQGSRHEGEL